MKRKVLFVYGSPAVFDDGQEDHFFCMAVMGQLAVAGLGLYYMGQVGFCRKLFHRH